MDLSTPLIPQTSLMLIFLVLSVVIMETNKRLEESLKSRSLPIHERYTVKSDGFGKIDSLHFTLQNSQDFFPCIRQYI